jgi:LAO/AO transport system kinase
MVGNAFEPVTFAEKVAELVQKLEQHYLYLRSSGRMVERINRKIIVEISDALRANILEPIMRQLEESGELQSLAQKVKNREVDPYSAAEEIAKRFIK